MLGKLDFSKEVLTGQIFRSRYFSLYENKSLLVHIPRGNTCMNIPTNSIICARKIHLFQYSSNFPSKQLFSVSASRRGKWRKVKKNEYFTNRTPLSVLSITLNNITYYRGSCDYLQVFIEHRLKKVYVLKHLYSY